MKESTAKPAGRGSFLSSSAALVGASFWPDETLEALPQNTRTNSKASALRITDFRVTVIARTPFTVPLPRIDTNEGISGLGEVRDGASKNYAPGQVDGQWTPRMIEEFNKYAAEKGPKIRVPARKQ